MVELKQVKDHNEIVETCDLVLIGANPLKLLRTIEEPTASNW